MIQQYDQKPVISELKNEENCHTLAICDSQSITSQDSDHEPGYVKNLLQNVFKNFDKKLFTTLLLFFYFVEKSTKSLYLNNFVKSPN